MQVVTLGDVASADGQPLFVEFANTLHWYEGAPIELIGTDSELAEWLAEHDLPADDLAGRLPDIHQFRAHVRGLTEALASRRPLPQADMQALEAALSAPTGSMTLLGNPSAAQQSHLGFATDAAGTALFSFQIALSLTVFLRSAQRKRLKLCANPGCGFAFLDTSINATRRWCFMRYCGNRVKVRAFRGRQKTGSAAP